VLFTTSLAPFIVFLPMCSLAINRIPQFVAYVFGATKLLALVKFLGDIQLIIMGKALYRLVNRV
jgi:hypothetical protein